MSGIRKDTVTRLGTQGSRTGYMLGQTLHMRSNLAKIFGLVQHTVCVKRTRDTHDSRQQIAMGTQSQGTGCFTPDNSQESTYDTAQE